jgi:hypothetical protein
VYRDTRTLQTVYRHNAEDKQEVVKPVDERDQGFIWQEIVQLCAGQQRQPGASS